MEVKRAKIAIDKRAQFVPRAKQFIQRSLLVDILARLPVVEQILDASAAESFAMLYLAAYTFLLRVPSEALPMRKGGPGVSPKENQSVITLEKNQVRFC